MLLRLSGARDPRASDYHTVSDSNLVRRRGLFIAEGRSVVERLIRDRRYSIRSLLLSDTAHDALAPALDALGPETPVYLLQASDFEAVTGVHIHRGCLALAERPPDVPVAQVLSGARTLVILEGVANADNIGGVFRNAAAFAVDGVLLSPTCCDPFYRKAIRTSVAATLRVPFARVTPWPDGLAEVRREGFTLVALTPRSDAQALDGLVASGPPERVAVMFGSEGHGLTNHVLALADRLVRIPIVSAIDSLNLAVASGVTLARLSEGRAF